MLRHRLAITRDARVTGAQRRGEAEVKYGARMVEVRDLRFPLDSVPRDWHPAGLAVTGSRGQLSVFVPVGETFFVRSVRHCAGQLLEGPSALSSLIGPGFSYFVRDFDPAQRGGLELVEAWKRSVAA